MKLPLEKRLQPDDPLLRSLPDLSFEDTRQVGTIIEVGRIRILMADGEIRFQDPSLMLGIYFDDKTERHYLIHTPSERPPAGFPTATSFEIIEGYEFVREYGITPGL